MYDYNKLFLDFLQYKHYLGYKYKTDEIVLKEIVKYLTENNIDIITKDVIEDYARLNSNLILILSREIWVYLKNFVNT